MTELAILGKGAVLGFSIAAPVGPIGVLCIRRTLNFGAYLGFLTGFGAAMADALYGCVAAFGLTSLSSAFLRYHDGFRVAGGAVLLLVAMRILFSSAHAEDADARRITPSGAFATAFGLTLANPATILSFFAAFASFDVVSLRTAPAYLSSLILVCGVFLGSCAWWIILSCGTGTFRDRITGRHKRWINVGSGLVLATFALMAMDSVWNILDVQF